MAEERRSSQNGACTSADRLIETICRVAGSPTLIEETRAGLAAAGVLEAVRTRDDDVLFEWLIDTMSYQGIGDAVAYSYMEDHGRIRAEDIRTGLLSGPSCPKLTSYWTFHGCRFHKGSRTCAEPEHQDTCPLPAHDLRNGRLNQTAYSLFLFFRDVTGRDFVGWLDQRLVQAAAHPDITGRTERLRHAILQPLSHVYGVSNKVLSMALSDLLIAADPDRPLWMKAGAGMIAVDTLVHNWLHRTGTLLSFGAEHPYGERCYRANGCAAILEQLSARIDARQFNPEFPATFPRFVQKAIWHFCAQWGLDECNGHRIDDRLGCARHECQLGALCERRPLRSASTS
jgi:hypothetical protein